MRKLVSPILLAAIIALATNQAAEAAPSVCDATSGNLVTNCGFESGPVSNLGFTSAYAYTSNLLPAGTFYIGSNPDAYNPFFGTPTASPNSGNDEMIINGSSAANTTVWQESSIAVIPHTTYYFSVFAASVDPISGAILDFTANGTQLGNTFTLGTGTGFQNMSEFFATWNSGANTSVTLALVDQNTSPGGNDFALDDFVFDTTQPTGGTGVGGTGGGTPVPEPSTILLFLGTLGSLGWIRGRRRH